MTKRSKAERAAYLFQIELYGVYDQAKKGHWLNVVWRIGKSLLPQAMGLHTLAENNQAVRMEAWSLETGEYKS